MAIFEKADEVIIVNTQENPYRTLSTSAVYVCVTWQIWMCDN